MIAAKWTASLLERVASALAMARATSDALDKDSSAAYELVAPCAQTPQAFRYDLLLRANEEARAVSLPSAAATDDSFLVERLGLPVAVVEGSPNNIKITTPDDLLLAEKLYERVSSRHRK